MRFPQLPSGMRRLGRSARYAAPRVLSGFYLHRFRQARQDRRRLAEVRIARHPSGPEPLVSIVIATYNRGDLLVERAVASALRQTHPNIEVVVVGDHCTDDTVVRMATVEDPRVRFLNLAKRGEYPADPWKRWLVAGVVPMNKAVELSQGEWIAPLDDDDTFSEDHVEALLAAARSKDAELAYGQIEMEQPDGTSKVLGSQPLRMGAVTRMALLYRRDLAFIENDIGSWRWGEPADWALVRRMRDAGVRITFVAQVLGKHYAERKRMGT